MIEDSRKPRIRIAFPEACAPLPEQDQNVGEIETLPVVWKGVSEEYV